MFVRKHSFSSCSSRGEDFASYAKGIEVKSPQPGSEAYGRGLVTDSPTPKGVCRIRGFAQIFTSCTKITCP